MPLFSLGQADERNGMGTERSEVGMKCSEGSDPSKWNRGLGAVRRKGHYGTTRREKITTYVQGQVIAYSYGLLGRRAVCCDWAGWSLAPPTASA